MADIIEFPNIYPIEGKRAQSYFAFFRSVIPSSYREFDWTTLRCYGRETSQELQRQAYTYLLGYLNAFGEQLSLGRHLVLFGPEQTGKSLWGILLGRVLSSRGYYVDYICCEDYCYKLSPNLEDDFLLAAKKPDFLILDGLKIDMQMPNVVRRLDNLLAMRSELSKPVLLLSQWGYAQLFGRLCCEQSQRHFLENSLAVPFEWEGYLV